MKKIFGLINSDRAAGGRIALLLLLYALQALFQVAQPEVLNQAMDAVGAGDWDMLKLVVGFAVFVTAGTLLVEALIKLRLVSFLNRDPGLSDGDHGSRGSCGAGLRILFL